MEDEQLKKALKQSKEFEERQRRSDLRAAQEAELRESELMDQMRAAEEASIKAEAEYYI